MTDTLRELPLHLRQWIRIWKKEYPRLFLSWIQDDDGFKPVVYRGLTKREADEVDAEPDEVVHVDTALRLGLLHPDIEEMEDWSAGAVHAVYEAICSVSGWRDGEFLQVMEEASGYLDTLHGGITAFVCSVLPIRPAEVYEMDAHELAKHLKIAELAKGQPFPWKMYLDPEGWAQENRSQMRKIEGRRPNLEGDPREVAMAMGSRSADEILTDPNAVNMSNPNSIRDMIRKHEMGSM